MKEKGRKRKDKRKTGVYILEFIPPPMGRGNISRCHLAGKYEQVEEKKEKKLKEKENRQKKSGN